MQTEIDFSRRGEQLRLLDRIQFQRGLGVAPATLCLVLRVVDSFAGDQGWCWAASGTMGQRANLCDRTVRNALKILHELFLVRKQQRVSANGSRQCRYQIVWSNVSAQVEELQAIGLEPDGWEEIDQASGNPTEDQRKEIPNQRKEIPQPTEYDDRPNGTPFRLSAKEPQIPPPLTEPREEEAVLKLLEGRVSKSEAKRLSRKVDAETVATALEEFDHPANRNLLRSAGAIVHRLDFGEWPDSRVKTLEDIREAEAVTQRQRSQEDAQRAAAFRRLAEADQQAAELENRFGAILDAMLEDDLNRLARSTLDDFNYCRWVRGGDYRRELLEAMAGRQVETN